MMLRLRRAKARTHGRLFRHELGASLDHAARAAGHAAGGTRAAIGPRLDTARDYVGPTAGRVREAARESWHSGSSAFAEARDNAAKQAKRNSRAANKRMKKLNGGRGRMSGKRGSVLIGLLAVAAAAGVAGAVIVQRRRQQWEEFEAVTALEAAEAERTRATGLDPDDTRAPSSDSPADVASRVGNAARNGRN